MSVSDKMTYAEKIELCREQTKQLYATLVDLNKNHFDEEGKYGFSMTMINNMISIRNLDIGTKKMLNTINKGE